MIKQHDQPLYTRRIRTPCAGVQIFGLGDMGFAVGRGFRIFWKLGSDVDLFAVSSTLIIIEMRRLKAVLRAKKTLPRSPST